MIYEGYGDHRGRTRHALVFFIFLLTVRRVQMFFSLKNHPLKLQLAGVRRFGGAIEQTNRQTDLLTDWRFYRVIHANTHTHTHKHMLKHIQTYTNTHSYKHKQ